MDVLLQELVDVCGRKPLPSSAPKVITAKKMHADKTIKIEDICKRIFAKR